MHSRRVAALGAIVAVLAAHASASAQDLQQAAGTAAPPPMVILADSASPFGTPAAADLDPAGVELPVLDFVPAPTDAADFDKYYYFRRDNTDFATAYADIRECDGYASGLQSGAAYDGVPYPYQGTMAGAVGGAIGSAMVMAIFGSAEKRKARRVNMRTCMFFKGYARHGLPKQQWSAFNFEEGIGHVGAERRTYFLKRQALAATTPAPKAEALGL